MAIDTQQKRMSVAGCGRPFMRATFPVTTPTEAWRASVAHTYSGNSFDGGAGVPLADGRMTTINRRFTRPTEILG